jgi:hypothetical protein
MTYPTHDTERPIGQNIDQRDAQGLDSVLTKPEAQAFGKNLSPKTKSNEHYPSRTQSPSDPRDAKSSTGVKMYQTTIDWRGDLTSFNGFFDVFPAVSKQAASWEDIKKFVAGDVIIGSDKTSLPYFVPCQLKSAPFTSKTLPKAQQAGYGNAGKQRSANHVTEATWLVIDVDGLSEPLFADKIKAIFATGRAFRVFSTHSHGREDKPGVRARVFVPVDRPLNTPSYERAWLGFDKLVFDGAVAKQDASGRHLWQQQGVWATSSDRRNKAFCNGQDGMVWQADELIAASPAPPPKRFTAYQPVELSPSAQVQRLEAALPWIDAEDTGTWHTAITAFKAISTVVGVSNALELAVRYSAQGSEEAQKLNASDPRYDPASFFQNVNPTMPEEAAPGVLFGLAKEGALQAMRLDRGKKTWSEVGRAAAIYLCRYHPATFAVLAKGV